MNDWHGLRFLFITGKGGVGKSTVAALLGLKLAREGRKVLVVCPSGSRAMSRLYERSVGSQPTAIAPSLWAMTIEPEEAMREYAENAMGSRRLAGMVLSRQVARGFMNGIPGLLPWALLGKAWYATTDAETGPPLAGAPYDTVVFDGFATGDGTELLRVPKTILEIAPPSRLRRDAENCYELLRDQRRARVVPVVLPSSMPVTETAELIAEIDRSLGYGVGPLIVNQVRPVVFEQGERECLRRRGGDDTGQLRSASGFLYNQAELEAEQAAQLQVIESWGRPFLRLPLTLPEPVGLEALGHLSGLLT